MNNMTKPIKATVLAAALLAGAGFSPAMAHDAPHQGGHHQGAHHNETTEQAAAQESIKVTDAWARPTIGKLRITAAYFRIDLTGGAADKLIAASTPVSAKAELHEHVMEGDIAKMRHVEAVPVVSGTPTVFEPAGYHVMVMGLKEPLNEGDSFPLTLTFERAGDITVTVSVMKKGPAGHGSMDHGKMDHGSHKH